MQKSGKNLPDNFPVCWLPVPSLSVFHGNLPQKIRRDTTSPMFIMGKLFPLIGNQRVGIFPPKSKILFVLSLALIWCQNFQDRTIPVGGDTWPKLHVGKKNNKNNKNKEISRSAGCCFRSNISETVRDIRVPFSLWPRAIISRYQTVQTTSLSFLSSQRYIVVNFGICECWPVRRYKQ